jgi:hypothetical protein
MCEESADSLLLFSETPFVEIPQKALVEEVDMRIESATIVLLSCEYIAQQRQGIGERRRGRTVRQEEEHFLELVKYQLLRQGHGEAKFPGNAQNTPGSGTGEPGVRQRKNQTEISESEGPEG